MRPTLSLIAMAIVLVFAPDRAAAQDFSWHAGLGLGAELDDRGPFPHGDIDAEHTRTVFVGATHRSGFGAELAWVDLGSLTASNIADGGFAVDGELWSLGLTFAIAMEAFEPYAKLGVFSRNEDGFANTIAGPRPLLLDDDGAMGEVGLRWRVTEPVALRLGYAWYDFEPDADGGAQLAAEWRF